MSARKSSTVLQKLWRNCNTLPPDKILPYCQACFSSTSTRPSWNQIYMSKKKKIQGQTLILNPIINPCLISTFSLRLALHSDDIFCFVSPNNLKCCFYQTHVNNTRFILYSKSTIDKNK
jgi:hypothetical protein